MAKLQNRCNTRMKEMILIKVDTAKGARNSYFMSSVCFLYIAIFEMSVIFRLLPDDPRI